MIAAIDARKSTDQDGGAENQEVFNGVDVHRRPLRSHVERVVDPTAAAVPNPLSALWHIDNALYHVVNIL